MKNKRVLVTGAGGFIGSHLTERLVQEGARVRALVHYNSRGDWGLLELLPREIRAELEVTAGDIADLRAVRLAVDSNECVFHLASLISIPYSYEAPQSYVVNNVGGTLNVMQAAVDGGVDRVVHTSTSECYGSARYVPMDEAHPLQAQSPYSASKIGADAVAESYHRSFGLPVATVRPFNTYGPRQSARAVIPTIILQALTGGAVRLGSLAPRRDFNYVDDTVDGFVRAASANGAVGEVVNLGSGREVSVGDVCRLVIERIGRQVHLETEDQRVRPAASEVERLLCDARKAKQVLGWHSTVALEEGLVRTIEWFRMHLERYKPDLYNI
jgi:dTDP-glucose 4,6-dehydratase